MPDMSFSEFHIYFELHINHIYFILTDGDCS